MSYVVCWSGGIDSTLVLDHYAKVSCYDHEIKAISIISHPNLIKEFMKAQQIARKNYLLLAKKRGYHIKHYRISIGGNWNWKFKPDSFIHNTGQSIVWLSSLINMIGSGDEVLMGYIRNDCFWHYRELFEDAFNAMCRLKGIEAKISYPFEYHNKKTMLSLLKKNKIPNRCWFSCDETKNGKPCGECEKYKEIDDLVTIKRDKKTFQLIL